MIRFFALDLRLTAKGFQSGNQESKIQNSKWAGLHAIAFVLVLATGLAEAQQPSKIAPHWVFDKLRCPHIFPCTKTARRFPKGPELFGYFEGKNILIEYRYPADPRGRYRISLPTSCG